MPRKKIISVIPANPDFVPGQGQPLRKKRVAAYCRVSTDHEDQESSYEAQVAYYHGRITSNPEWEFAWIFADKGLSGVNVKKRPQFLKLIQLCKDGKIDMVLTKSISRFSRNTLDCIRYIRMLKDKGIPVIFEKESINTMDAASEMMLSILGSFAQAESESLSRNVAWGKRQSFRNGNVPFHFSRILGYEKGADGNPKIVPEQAEIVKRIFQSYLVGSSTTQIKAELEAEGIPSPSGKNIWSVASIKQILRNEKYKGDALLQKTYVPNFLNKKSVKNNGELPQYYVSDHHEAIIPEDVFNRVQEEIARRNCKPKSAMKIAKTENGKYSGKYALSELLFCGNCGTPYRRVTWARNGKKRIVWRCISRLEHGTEYCKNSPTIEESQLHEAIMKAIQRFIEDEKEMKENVLVSLKGSLNGKTNEFSLRETESHLNDLKDKLAGLAEAGIEADGDIETYGLQFKETLDEIKALENSVQIHRLKSSIDQNADPRFKEIMNLLNGDEIKIDEYDDVLVRQVIKEIKVMPAERLQITFKCGLELLHTYLE